MSPSQQTGDIAANVRAEVARRQMRQRTIAACLDLDQRAVSRRMRGDVEFSLSELRRLATELDVPLTSLLGEVSPESVGS